MLPNARMLLTGTTALVERFIQDFFLEGRESKSLTAQDGFLANTRPHQLHWGDWEMGTTISCTESSQVAGFIQKAGRSASEAPSL